jgi:hypothetical protein
MQARYLPTVCTCRANTCSYESSSLHNVNTPPQAINASAPQEIRGRHREPSLASQIDTRTPWLAIGCQDKYMQGRHSWPSLPIQIDARIPSLTIAGHHCQAEYIQGHHRWQSLPLLLHIRTPWLVIAANTNRYQDGIARRPSLCCVDSLGGKSSISMLSVPTTAKLLLASSFYCLLSAQYSYLVY